MNWKDRVELLNYYASAMDEQRRRAESAKNTLRDFVDELIKRTTVPSNIVNVITELLDEAGVIP